MLDYELMMKAINRVWNSGRKSALATVVNVDGSAYRREGAKLLVDENGNIFGMISAGCLESDVAEVAKFVMESGTPILKTYNLDENLVWGLGLGCPGTVNIYIEPIKPISNYRKKDYMLNLLPFEAWLKSLEEERESVLATILPVNQTPSRKEPFRLFISKELVIGDLGDVSINEQVMEIARRKLNESNPKSEKRTLSMQNGEDIHIFMDMYIPPAELMIFGAGHDAIPVAKYAASLGFKTTVVDEREFLNTEERFPNSVRLLVKTSEFSEKITISRRTYLVIMNHHIERDQETLKFVLRSNSPYIGVLGPRSRRLKMINALKEEGIFFEPHELDKMYSPIGLDIGALSPEEIALSILAEVVAKKNGHEGGFLKGSDSIHKSTAEKETV